MPVSACKTSAYRFNGAMEHIPAKFKSVFQKYAGTFPVPLVEIARELGVHVYLSNELDEGESGVIRQDSQARFGAYLNARHSMTRRRFTLAHQIAHRILHEDRLRAGEEHSDGVAQYVGLPHRGEMSAQAEAELELEKTANALAAEILMPSDIFREAWGKYAEREGIQRIARKFGVSEGAAAIRGVKLLGYEIP